MLIVRPGKYPRRAVHGPTIRQNENVSPGRMSTPFTLGAASDRLTALFSCSFWSPSQVCAVSVTYGHTLRQAAAHTADAGKNAHRKTYPAHAAQNGTFSWRANKPTGPSRKKACAFFPFFKTLSKTASDRAAFPLAERVAASACFQPEAGTQKEIPARRPS